MNQLCSQDLFVSHVRTDSCWERSLSEISGQVCPWYFEYNMIMELPQHCNTIGRIPLPSPTLGQSTYLHLQANILDAVTFLWSRWFSKSLQHSPTQAITLPYARREISPLFLHLFHPFHPLCCCLLFLLHCLPVLTTKALYKERKAQCSSGSRADSTGPKVDKDFSVMERGNIAPSNLFPSLFLFEGWKAHEENWGPSFRYFFSCIKTVSIQLYFHNNSMMFSFDV